MGLRNEILEAVNAALQNAEEMGGIEEGQYALLMNDVIAECKQRRANYMADVARDDVAKRFSTLLRDALTCDEMVMVIARNEIEGDDSICHSHDFCDANMIMGQAICDIIGAHDTGDADVQQLWGAAWKIAIKNGFSL